jgi:hypothetical protein
MIYVVVSQYEIGSDINVECLTEDPQKASDVLGRVWTDYDGFYENGRIGYRKHNSEEFLDSAPNVTDGTSDGIGPGGGYAWVKYEKGRIIQFAVEEGVQAEIICGELT